MAQQRYIIPRDYPFPSGTGHDSNATRWEKTQDNFDELYSIRYDDLRFPAQGINPAGTAAPPSVITDTAGYTGCLSFAGNAENLIAGVAQLPHSWDRGTPIYPHIHWTRATGGASPYGTVDWKFYYRILGNPGDSAGDWSSAQSVDATVGDTGTAGVQIISGFPDIDLSAYKESVVILWRLHRMGNTDSESGAAILYELDFHFAIDKRGTETVIPA